MFVLDANNCQHTAINLIFMASILLAVYATGCWVSIFFFLLLVGQLSCCLCFFFLPCSVSGGWCPTRVGRIPFMQASLGAGCISPAFHVLLKPMPSGIVLQVCPSYSAWRGKGMVHGAAWLEKGIVHSSAGLATCIGEGHPIEASNHIQSSNPISIERQHLWKGGIQIKQLALGKHRSQGGGPCHQPAIHATLRVNWNIHGTFQKLRLTVLMSKKLNMEQPELSRNFASHFVRMVKLDMCSKFSSLRKSTWNTCCSSAIIR